jgi:Tfp pilus assembly protein PilN
MNGQPEIQINLINYKLEQKTNRNSMIMEWGIYLLVTILIIGGISFYNHLLENKIEALNNENSNLQTELKQTTVQTSAMQTTKKIEAVVKTRSLLVESLLKQENDYVPFFDELGQLNGSGILLSNIDMQKDRVNIKGYASGHRQMINLLQSLQDSEYFSVPANLQMSTNKDTGEISFSMQMSLEEAKK